MVIFAIYDVDNDMVGGDGNIGDCSDGENVMVGGGGSACNDNDLESCMVDDGVVCDVIASDYWWWQYLQCQ